MSGVTAIALLVLRTGELIKTGFLMTWLMCFPIEVMQPNNVDRMRNVVDPDQEKSTLCFHCFLLLSV